MRAAFLRVWDIRRPAARDETTTMSLAELLGSTYTPAAFLDQYYLKLPLALAGGCQALCELGGWQTVERILAHPEADVLVVKSGEQRPAQGNPSYAEARTLHAEGYTIVLRHVERLDAALGRLAAAFARELLAAPDIHIYCTPASQFGFGWHYDAEEVFILQTEGSKEYSLRKNTVHPWPVIEAMPHDMGFEREIMPLFNCTLAAGDWLYIPGGYWHRAASRTDSISVAVGLMAPTALDVCDFVRSRLPSSLVWRQRLPVTTAAAGDDAAAARQHLEKLCQQLGQDLARALSDPRAAGEFLDYRRRQLGVAESDSPATDVASAAGEKSPNEQSGNLLRQAATPGGE